MTNKIISFPVYGTGVLRATRPLTKQEKKALGKFFLILLAAISSLIIVAAVFG